MKIKKTYITNEKKKKYFDITVYITQLGLRSPCQL